MEKYRNSHGQPGADPGFQVRGGALKKIASSGGRRENFWGISCEKSRFYAKKSYFFQLRREARKCLRYLVWKITILRKKIYIFSKFRGGARRVRPPLDPPLATEGEFVSPALFNTNFISKSFGGPLHNSAGKGTRHLNPLEDYRFFHLWFSGVKTP